MTIIKQLKDESNNAFYPQTVKSAVSDWDAAKITVTATDPGEGSSLPSGEFVAVVGDPDIYIQSGSFAFTIAGNSSDTQTVTLPTALSSATYQVFLQPTGLTTANCQYVFVSPASLTSSSFAVNIVNTSSNQITGTLAWMAVKVG